MGAEPTPTRAFLTAFLFAVVAAPARPCTVVVPLPSPQELVQRAEVIVRVRAQGFAETPGRVDFVLAVTPRQVRFAVLEVLKGRLPSTQLEFNGALSDADDRNDGPVPFEQIRPGGRGGGCFALTYRPGGEYLLLLARAERSADGVPADLTPYWAPLGPTNEQLFGGTDDAWFVWVSQRIRGQ